MKLRQRDDSPVYLFDNHFKHEKKDTARAWLLFEDTPRFW